MNSFLIFYVKIIISTLDYGFVDENWNEGNEYDVTTENKTDSWINSYDDLTLYRNNNSIAMSKPCQFVLAKMFCELSTFEEAKVF